MLIFENIWLVKNLFKKVVDQDNEIICMNKKNGF